MEIVKFVWVLKPTETLTRLLSASRSTAMDAVVDRPELVSAECFCYLSSRPTWPLRSTAAQFWAQWVSAQWAVDRRGLCGRPPHCLCIYFVLVVYFIRPRGRLDYLTLHCNDSDLSIHVSWHFWHKFRPVHRDAFEFRICISFHIYLWQLHLFTYSPCVGHILLLIHVLDTYHFGPCVGHVFYSVHVLDVYSHFSPRVGL